MKPVFSVITVHYNQLPLLRSTVENIINQEGFGEIIEYIIVDGLSKDGTIDYLHSLKVEKSIHRLIESDKGIYDAMNKGVAMALGEYVVFINAGDQFHAPDTLKKIHEKYPNFDVLYGDTIIHYEKFSRIATTHPIDKFWQCLPFVHQSVLVKKNILPVPPFNTSYKFCADFEQLYKLYLAGHDFKKYHLPIAQIAAGGTSDINSFKATQEVYKISKKLAPLKLIQKIYFKNKLARLKTVKIIKKALPKKSVDTVTKYKYK